MSENATHRDLWDYFCNKPAILGWHEQMPKIVKNVLEQDMRKTGDRDYDQDYEKLLENDFEGSADVGEVYKPPTWGGKDGKNKNYMKRSSSASLLSCEEGLTVEHKAVERSAKMLCSSQSSTGPDYVNVPEGLFCRSEYSQKTHFQSAMSSLMSPISSKRSQHLGHDQSFCQEVSRRLLMGYLVLQILSKRKYR